MNDTGLNLAEPLETLLAQQQQLLAGRRAAQMFPNGTQEIGLPAGFARVQTSRGVFHFNPVMTSTEEVINASRSGRENEILALGPFSKIDVVNEHQNTGVPVFAVTERTPSGLEVKSAIGTPRMIPDQLAHFRRTSSPGNLIAVEAVSDVLRQRYSASQRFGG